MSDKTNPSYRIKPLKDEALTDNKAPREPFYSGDGELSVNKLEGLVRDYVSFCEYQRSHADKLQAELDEARSTIKALESSRLPDYLHELVRSRNLVLEKRLEKCEGLLKESMSDKFDKQLIKHIENVQKYFAEVEGGK